MTYTKEQYNKTYRGEAIYRILKNGVEIASDIRECNLRPLAFYDQDNHPTVSVKKTDKPFCLHRIKDAEKLHNLLLKEGKNPHDYLIGFTNCALTGHKIILKGEISLPARINTGLGDSVGIEWWEMSDIEKMFWQIPQGESVQIIDEHGHIFSYSRVINAIKQFARLAGMEIRGIEPWYNGSYGFKFRTNLKKWLIKINHDGSLSLCHD